MKQNLSLDLQINFPEEDNNNIINNSNTFFQNQNNSQSTTSIDLNKFKIPINNNTNSNDNFATFNPKPNPQISKTQNKENFQLNNIITQNQNIPILSSFKPYNINTFLDKNISKNKSPQSTDTVNNISAISSNYKYFIYSKKIEEEKYVRENCFKKLYQQESRRMMIEYVRLIAIKENAKTRQKLLNILNENNLTPYLLQKTKSSTDNIGNLSGRNNYNSNSSNNYKQSFIMERLPKKRGTDLTLGESVPTKRENEGESSFIRNSNAKDNISNSLKLLNIFLSNMEDDSNEKIALLTFITIPRLMKMVINNTQKFPFIFSASPSSISFSFGIESYIFKWNDCNSYKQIGCFDLINVDTCMINQNIKNQFDIIITTNNKREYLSYSIEAENELNASNYVNSINFLTQLIKCRAFIRTKKK